jgi:hypothetical protein
MELVRTREMRNRLTIFAGNLKGKLSELDVERRIY